MTADALPSPRHRAGAGDALSHRAAPWLGAGLMVIALAGGFVDPAAFFASWLAAAWFALGASSGALVWLWIHRLTGGRWGDALRPALLRLAARLPRTLLLFVPLAFGAPLLYPPFHAAAGTPPAVAAWLANWHAQPFVAGRCVVYALVWLVLARRTLRAHGDVAQGEAAGALMLHLVVTTLAAVDLLVALVPNWSSSIFGLLVLAGQGSAGLAAAVALGGPSASDGDARPAGAPPLSRDHGNLLLATVLVWAYLAFMQLLIMWAEDLPREIAWYLPRLQTDWVDAGIALVLLHLALPFAALLFRAVKDRPDRLAVVAAVVVAGEALDAVWLVLPSVAPHAASAAWLAPLAMAGLTLVAFGGTVAAPRAVAPRRAFADGRV